MSPLAGSSLPILPIVEFTNRMVDFLAVLGTLLGLATSLGLGAAQINAGLLRLFDTPKAVNTQVLIIIFITFCATLSVVMGLDKGIRRLSEFNLWLAALLMLFVLAAGPTGALLRGLPDHLGGYLQGLVAVFFITSSDSGSYVVVDMLTSGGDPDPPVWQRVFWASTEGLLAIVLLIGGLNALQAGAVSMGLPFCLVMIAVV